jgi:hypothetical protein
MRPSMRRLGDPEPLGRSSWRYRLRGAARKSTSSHPRHLPRLPIRTSGRVDRTRIQTEQVNPARAPGRATHCHPRRTSLCLITITLFGAPLLVIMLLMVRHAATVRPVATVMLGGLSAAAMSTAGIGLTHGGETALTVLLWHVGAVSLLALVTMAFSRRLFDLIGYRRTTDERPLWATTERASSKPLVPGSIQSSRMRSGTLSAMADCSPLTRRCAEPAPVTLETFR